MMVQLSGSRILTPWLIYFIPISLAGSVTLDWSIGWVNAAPDGYSRPVIAINGQWPPPWVEVNYGDIVTVNLKNDMGNETTALHFHGMSMHGAPSSDGPAGIAQCRIPPGESFTQQFTADPAGSSWYHAHEGGSYPDGLRGPFIVRDYNDWFYSKVSDTFVMTVTDWYHRQMPEMVHEYMNAVTPAAPIPDSVLINDGGRSSYSMEPGKSYLFSIINMSAVSPFSIQFMDHDMTVVRADGSLVEPKTTSKLYISPGQRYEVLITAQSASSLNYPIFVLDELFGLQAQGCLEYGYNELAEGIMSTENALDEYTLTAADQAELWGPVSKEITLNVNVLHSDVGWRSVLGEQSYVSPKVPSLFTALTTSNDAFNATVYGGVAAFVVDNGDIVQVVINNPSAEHPMHLHGHQFQYVYRTDVLPFDGNTEYFVQRPLQRDTVILPARSSIVLRFIANNPGVWPLHCHIEWHIDIGMIATIVEAPDRIQSEIQVPGEHIALCQNQGVMTAGNCAGNTDNPLDTSECNWNVQPASWGSLIVHE